MVLRGLLEDDTLPELPQTLFSIAVSLPGLGLVTHVIDSLFIPGAIKFSIDTGLQLPINQTPTFISNLDDAFPIEVSQRLLQISSLMTYLVQENLGMNFTFRLLFRSNDEKTYNRYSYELLHKDYPVYLFRESKGYELMQTFQEKISEATNSDVLLSANAMLGSVRQVYRTGLFKDILTEYPLEETELVRGNRSGDLYLFNTKDELIPDYYYEEITTHVGGKLNTMLENQVLPSNTALHNQERLKLRRLKNGQYESKLELPPCVDVYSEFFTCTVTLDSLTKLYRGLKGISDFMYCVTVRVLTNGSCVSIETKYLEEYIRFQKAFKLDNRREKVELVRYINPEDYPSNIKFIDETIGAWCVML